jgi:hypothetical protein
MPPTWRGHNRVSPRASKRAAVGFELRPSIFANLPSRVARGRAAPAVVRNGFSALCTGIERATFSVSNAAPQTQAHRLTPGGVEGKIQVHVRCEYR